MTHDESLGLIQGTLEMLILQTLAWAPMHGYGISRCIRRRTDGELAIQDAALYQALRRMERKGWVDAEWGMTPHNRRARFYTLTPEGRRQLEREVSAWKRYADAVARVLAPPAHGEA